MTPDSLDSLLSALGESPDDRDLRLVASDAFEEAGRHVEAGWLRSDQPIIVMDGKVHDLAWSYRQAHDFVLDDAARELWGIKSP